MPGAEPSPLMLWGRDRQQVHQMHNSHWSQLQTKGCCSPGIRLSGVMLPHNRCIPSNPCFRMPQWNRLGPSRAHSQLLTLVSIFQLWRRSTSESLSALGTMPTSRTSQRALLDLASGKAGHQQGVQAKKKSTSSQLCTVCRCVSDPQRAAFGFLPHMD